VQSVADCFKGGSVASKIYIDNLPADITEERLKDTFAQIGEVETVKLKTDFITRRSKGRGIIEMALDVDAYRAVNCFNGATIKDRRIHLTEEMPLIERARTILSHQVQVLNEQGLGSILRKQKTLH
jgi:RNA recognition motif-containing protein